MNKPAAYPLRMPQSVKTEAEKLARAEGVSFNQFAATAIAEKVATLKTAAFFEERRNRADREAFRRVLNRSGGQPPRADDEVDE